MARIDPLDGAQGFRRSEKKSRKKGKSERSGFASLFREVREGGEAAASPAGDEPLPEGALEDLLDEVHGAADALLAAPTMENVRAYRAAVRGFLKSVMDRMLGVEERTSGVNILKRKRFTQLRIVDEKLERLVRDLLQQQRRQLDILQRVNEINGMLVDLIT